MGFAREVEDEVIREAFLNKLDRPIVSQLNKVWRDSTQNKNPNLLFQIGEYIRYIDEGHNEILGLVYIKTNDHDITHCSIKLLRLNTITLTKEFLKSRNVPDIGSIPIYSKYYINESNNITQEKLIISCFFKFYHLYNRNSNPGMTSYLTDKTNPCLE